MKVSEILPNQLINPRCVVPFAQLRPVLAPIWKAERLNKRVNGP